MPANAQVYSTTTIQGSPIVTTAETVIATISSVSITPFAQNVRFIVGVGLTPAADSTGVVFKVRRNSVTGTTVVTVPSIGTTAAVAVQLPFLGVAASEPVGFCSYVVTAVITAASANTTVANVTAVAIVGN